MIGQTSEFKHIYRSGNIHNELYASDDTRVDLANTAPDLTSSLEAEQKLSNPPRCKSPGKVYFRPTMHSVRTQTHMLPLPRNPALIRTGMHPKLLR